MEAGAGGPVTPLADCVAIGMLLTLSDIIARVANMKAGSVREGLQGGLMLLVLSLARV